MAEDHLPSRLDAISTRWTMLREAHGGGADSQAARNALVLRYLPAVRRYVGAILQNDQEAEDMTQDVLVRLLAGDFAGADIERGRFRDLLKVAIRNMIRNRWSRQKRRRPVNYDVAEVSDSHDADDGRWLTAWRQSTLDLAWKALEQQQRSLRGNVAYTLLRLRADFPDDTSEQLAARLSAKVGEPIRADACRQKLRRARLQFADLLIAEVAKGLHDPTPEKLEDELVALELVDYVRDLLPDERH